MGDSADGWTNDDLLTVHPEFLRSLILKLAR